MENMMKYYTCSTLYQLSTNKEDNSELFKALNDYRRKSKNTWYCVEVKLLNFNCSIKMKVFNTWIQIFRLEENNKKIIETGSSMSMKVGEWKQWLIDNFANVVKEYLHQRNEDVSLYLRN